MAEKNRAHSGCDCKVQEEKAISRGSQVTAVSIAPMRPRRGARTTAVVGIRTAVNKEAIGGLFSQIDESQACLAIRGSS